MGLWTRVRLPPNPLDGVLEEPQLRQALRRSTDAHCYEDVSIASFLGGFVIMVEECIKMNVNEFKTKLVEELSNCNEILGIGQTGDMNAPLVAGKSDIDMFIICKSVPAKDRRIAIYGALAGMYDRLDMEVCSGGIWGYGDIFYIDGIDVMPMFFDIADMRKYIDEVMEGKRLEKEGGFYPIGRLASIETINVLWEKDKTWTSIIEKVKLHPQELFDKWYSSEVWRIIDEEDLGRAELRHEVLFYHQVVEEFLDHFLQALYAKNRRYFPSRKRTESAIAEFELKPENCYERLLKIVRLGSSIDTIDESIMELRKLGKELMDL